MTNSRRQRFKRIFSPFTIDGRISRSEYWIWWIVYAICLIIMGIVINLLMAVHVDKPLFHASSGASSILSVFGLIFFVLFFVLFFWFPIVQNAKRCHDVGSSGFKQLIPFYILWLLIAEGDPYENDYGPDPRDLVDDNA